MRSAVFEFKPTRKVGSLRIILGGLALWFAQVVLKAETDMSYGTRFEDVLMRLYDDEESGGITFGFDHGFTAWIGANPNTAWLSGKVKSFDTLPEAVLWLDSQTTGR